MKTVGMPIPDMENEKRRALIPSDVPKLKYPGLIFIEEGYGESLGYNDEDYSSKGIRIASKEDVLKKDIICDPKVGDAKYLSRLDGQIIFGWVHAVQRLSVADKIIDRRLTSFAWEDMYEGGRHCFWRNNEIAGEAAVIHAYICHGIVPYHTKVAVLGRGNASRGAIKALNSLGAEVVQYDRRQENLFREELGLYDVIVNGILWDTDRTDHIIYREDLKRMKRGSLIIDIGCDPNGGVETCVPTTIEDPIYVIDGVTHYAVDHTPALFWKTASESISSEFVKYIDFLIEETADKHPVLSKCVNFIEGRIVDEMIAQYRSRHRL